MYARRICRGHQFKAVRKWKYAADARKEVGTIMIQDSGGQMGVDEVSSDMI